MCIIHAQVRVGVHGNSDIRMPHKVLQGLWIHSRLSHVRAVCMAAYVRGDIWHLDPVDFIVSLNHMVEAMFPVHGHQWKS